MQGRAKNHRKARVWALRAQMSALHARDRKSQLVVPAHSPGGASLQILWKSATSNYHFLKPTLNGGYHPMRVGSAKSLSVGPSGPNKCVDVFKKNSFHHYYTWTLEKMPLCTNFLKSKIHDSKRLKNSLHSALPVLALFKTLIWDQGGRGEISIGGAQQKLDKSSFIFPNFSLMSNNTFKISANDALTWLLFYFWKTVHIACIYKNSLE